MRTKEFLEKVLESDGKLTMIEFGSLLIVFGVVPLTLAANSLLLFGAITPTMAYTLFAPSIASTLLWMSCKNKKWFKKKYYW